MPVRKQAARKPAVQRTVTPPPKASEIVLPAERKRASTRIEDYSVLLYAVAKWGKTTFFSTFPDVLFLSTEPGTEGLEIFEIRVTDWSVMQQALKLLQKDNRFQNVVIDTADEAYRLCMEWVCRQRGLTHPSDANDYGKTWNAVADEFVRVFREIKATGRGCYLTAHDQEHVVESSTGQDYTRIGPTLTGKAGKRVLALADFIWYGDYARTQSGDEIRVIRTQGNELITGGARKIGHGRGLPLYIPLPEDESLDYDVFARAFRGEDVGIDPMQLRASVASSKAQSRQVKEDRKDTLLADGKEGKPRG